MRYRRPWYIPNGGILLVTSYGVGGLAMMVPMFLIVNKTISIDTAIPLSLAAFVVMILGIVLSIALPWDD